MLGVLMIVVGLIPPVHVFVQFVRAGGTPMPGAMTTRLVVTGFNRYVRNPIYLGAVAIFLGEALLLWRLNLLLYAIAAWLGAAAFVRWYEEPALVRRFGTDYQVYRRAVPAWRPRLRPWSPHGSGPRP
jgi:protein-S-isoprenylcysteine O-methyltransferase Ste14